MNITVEQVESIAERLRTLPAVENRQRVISKQESIKMLTAEITALQGRGYTLQQIAELLTSEKLEIGAPTLKSYLQRSKNSSKKALPRRKPAKADIAVDSASKALRSADTNPSAKTIAERPATALPLDTGSARNAAAAITRPDRERI